MKPEQDKKSFTIHDLPVAERPRERLQKYGAESLSAQEIITVLLGRGISGESVMLTAQRLLQKFEGPGGIAAASVEELSQVKGIGLAKACQLKAAFELARRVESGENAERPLIKTPEDVARLATSRLKEKKKEYFLAIMLDTKSRLIKLADISIGSLDSSLVHPREAFREVISSCAASVIFVHNHPSGDATPSDDDIKLTRRLAQAGKIIGIEVLDHVIIGGDRFLSLKREGIF